VAATVDRPAVRSVPQSSSVDEPGRLDLDFGRPLRLPPITAEGLGWLGLIALAFIMRIWELGTRALHHDESMHAFYGWQLFHGGGYQYNPMLHGPFQFHAIALMDFLFGPSDATARLTAVLCGTGMIVATWFLRPYLGRLGAFLAAAMLTISPSFLYFSRFTREDIYVTFFTYLMVVGMFGWLASRRPGYLYLAFIGTALAFCTKESTFITLFIFGTFLILTLAWENADRLPVLSAFTTDSPWRGRSDTEVMTEDRPVSVALRAITRHMWIVGLVSFGIIVVLLYTTMLTNRHGLQDAFSSSLSYWLGQQGVARGSQPGYYYALLLPAYEQVPVLFGLIGIGALVFRRWMIGFAAVVVAGGQALAVINGGRMMMPVLALTALILGCGAVALGLSKGRLFATFLAYWSIMAFIIYGWAGEKMPWLGMQMALPLLLMAALFLGRYLSTRTWDEWRVVAAAGAGLLTLFTIHADWPLNYIRGDIPRDFLIYTQTSPQVKMAVAQIDQLSNLLTGGTDLKVVVHNDDTWPFAWYLRDYKNLSYVNSITSPPDAPVVITPTDADAEVKPQMSNYVGNRLHLRTWFTEDYRDLTLRKVFQSATDPAMRKTLWNWLTLRETPSPLGTYDFDLWIRKDLAPGLATNFGFAPAPAAPAPTTALGPDPFADKTQKIASAQQFAALGTGDGQLTGARGVAVGSDGSIYVADQGNNRIQKFDAGGKFLLKWGSKGTGDGQFDSPSGVAVDKNGHVWVSDLWNHRIQEFDAIGKFLSKFGSYAAASGQDQPGKFFGPRYVAVGPDGSVYVSDTGNKRIQKFGPDGKFLRAWGQGGTGPGQFEEPMGLTVDGSGNVYVADTWNRRIQKFTADGQFISTVSVGSWPSAQASNGEPGLAVTSNGAILATDPLRARVLQFGPDGQLQTAWGGAGNDPSSLQAPTGIALAANDNIVVSDSLNSRIVVFPPAK